MEKRFSGHTSYSTQYHIVWNTKYRFQVLNCVRRKYLSQILSMVIIEMPGCEIVEHNILPDHVHLLLVIPPKYSVSEVVGRMKGIASSHLKKRFPKLGEIYWKENTVWSPGYCVKTVGIAESKIRSYIRNQ
jgi:putative transposase